MLPIGGSSITGDVAVPALAIGARQILVGVDDHQLGLARLVRRRRMEVEVAEQSAKGEMLILRQMLVAENITKFSASAEGSRRASVAERPRQFHLADLTADHRRQSVDGDRVVRRRFLGYMLYRGPSLERTASIALSSDRV